MRWFANLKTAYKLGLGFGFMVFLILLVGGVASFRMAQMNTNARLLNTDTIAGLKGIVQFTSAVNQVRRSQFQDILETDSAKMDKIEEEMKGKQEKVAQEITDYEQTITQEEDRTNLQELKSRWNSYRELDDSIKQLARKNDFKGSSALMMGKARDRFRAVTDVIDKMSDWNAKRGEKLALECEQTYLNARTTAGIIVAFAALLGLLLGWFITRTITPALAQVSERMATLRSKCLTELDQAMAALAAGDLTVSILPTTLPLDIERRDELGVMAHTFNQMLTYMLQIIDSYNTAQQSLSQLIGQVARNAESVSAMSIQLSVSAEQTGKAAEEIAHSMQEVAQAADQSATTSHEMAQGSEQQAQSASNAASNMEQLHAAIRQVQAEGQQQKQATQEASRSMQQASQAVEEVVRSSQQIADAARQANSIAQTGGQAVEQTVASMSRIKTQVTASAARVTELGKMGKAIGAIVETIDQIAEQTNLLALNAAIEAARAGQHGKGFAVVADEVRKLAERSTEATNEVGTLIDRVKQGVEEAVQAMHASSQEVTDGANRSQEAGQALTQILQAVQSVAAEVDTVSAIAEQMSASVQEVTATVDTVRRSAETNEQTVATMAMGADKVSSAITSVASISQETAAGAEEMSASAEEVSASAQNVSAAVEEQSASIEEVNATASELSSMSTQLQELISRFKLDCEPVAATQKLPWTKAERRKAA
ncbi:MAG TPA: methyl-accepting chemotaxis protein [Chthonomonadaceae bacterium]|nr:methyl-accepting chemotaxis protein [Chthonomonadaceae bacterium]